MNKKCLVIGGAGFIGSRLTKRLLDRGDEVYVMDNLSNGKLENIDKRAIFLKKDITNYGEIERFFMNIDFVFLLAALPRVQFSFEHPFETCGANVIGTWNCLQASLKHNVKKFVYSSSSSIYGDIDVFPITENSAKNPQSPYASHKLQSEELCKNVRKLGLSTVCLRYFNVYGENMSSEGSYPLVMGVFTKQLKEGKPLTITGDGNNSRDYTYIGDVCEANILSAYSDIDDEFNVGYGKDYKVIDVAKMFSNNYIFIDPRDEPKKTLSDSNKIIHSLGWLPKVALSDWLPKYIKKIKDEIKS